MTDTATPATDDQGAALAPRNGAAKKKGSTLQKVLARTTTDERGKGGTLRRRRICFVMDPSVCNPGVFDEPFELVVEAPSAEQELAAAKKYAQEPGAMIMELIRSSLVSVDGEPVSDGDLTRDAVWESLGMGGRALLAKKWEEINGVPAEALKKANETTRLMIG